MQERIGTYDIVDYLGAGGMATVYKAYQPKLDRHVAIKVLHQMFAQDEEFLARFEREARIVARLDHPNIVPVYDYDEHDGKPYLVMKYVEGHTLKEVLDEGTLPLEIIRAMMVKVADALTYAHQQGVLHRDFKPSNIMIDPTGTPYLMDFGLARIAQQGESTLSVDTMLGTPQYISPEQAQGLKDIDARTDVYGLGVVLYQLVAGRVPFVGDSAYAIVHKQIYAAPPLPSELNPEVPEAVDRVLTKALEKDPKDRYPTPNALIQAFESAITETGLQTLDEDRVSIAIKRGEEITERTPGGGEYAAIPTPFGEINVDNVLRDVGGRFRDAVLDIKQQLQDRGVFKKITEGAYQIAAHIESDSKKERSVRGGNSRRERRGQRMMEFDWSNDPSLVRSRIRRRANQRRGFFVHLLFFVFMTTLLYSVTPDIQNVLREWFSDPGFQETIGVDLTPLASTPIWGVFGLFWAAGLVSHAIEVAYNTGPNVNRKRRTLLGELEAFYGENWRDRIDGAEYQRMRKRVDERYQKRVALIQHFFSAVVSFFAISLLWAPIYEILVAQNVEFWGVMSDVAVLPMVVLFFMAISVIIHAFIMVIGLAIGADANEQAIRREMERERELAQLRSRAYEKPKNETMPDKAKNTLSGLADTPDHSPKVRLNADGEFTDSFADEIQNDTARSDN